ncbi:unnamed protein product [Mytilus coruscus]|uniref:Integrase catalytic domain-containing protein n=1 Tax=Mytilus coruscus TaxID=42192 RepID=A0A6J8AUM1_MYTCO|nr:unnamed protein product [Mytilus coruscus]
MLIGLDYPDLHYSYRDIRGKPGEPIARLTPLGWTCIGDPNSGQDQTLFNRTYFARGQENRNDLDNIVRKFWEIENVKTPSENVFLSSDEQKALSKVEQSLEFKDGHYEVKVPWKDDTPSLPNNYNMALSRLENTEKRLKKDPSIAKVYTQTIEKYIEKGYVRKVSTKEETVIGKWNLPHFPVIRPDKETTKTRIVFDASAKFQGISLNDTIHQGPKLQPDLFDVLLRLRKYPVALVCDIAEMYLRIKIAPDDRPYHRFLWRAMKSEQVPEEYEFNSVVFGVNSSPFQAQFVSRKHAEMTKDSYPRATETVLKSTYMDDSMDSVINDEQGIELYNQLSQLWEKAGMYARKWLSNSKAVLQCIPEEDRASQVDLDEGYLPSCQKKTTDKLTNCTTLKSIHTSDSDWRLDPVRYSSFVRLVRVQAYVYRFIDNCRLKQEQRRQRSLSTVEYADAELEIIKNAQREAFSDEYNALIKSKDLPKTSKLLGLQPRIDENGLIRCDGRLEYADFLSFDARYPIILPRKNWVTKLIVKRYHDLGKDVSGTNQTFSALSSRFWIISGREEIREYEHECYTCRKRKAKVAEQVMAPLPEIRFKTPLHAFARTAVDFGGPFITVQGRGKRRQKRNLCLFTCLASRAVHLEVAFGLDTDSFLNAFYRMVNRRGLPKEIISDNGTNFVGANRELKELVALLDTDKIQNSISNQGIKWHFNPPLAPHSGGIHETMIKSAKRAIYAILGNADINDEELLTSFTGAEALINSRPLTYQSADPKDDTPLTPNHFLHGQLGGHFAPESVDDTDFNPCKRWRRIQELIRHFWKRWIREWLPGLNKRDKWTKTKRDMKTDDIVLVMNPNVPRGHWPLGRIIEVFPGKDGHVRVAKVSLGQTVLIRPITKLCPLDIETSENDSDK